MEDENILKVGRPKKCKCSFFRPDISKEVTPTSSTSSCPLSSFLSLMLMKFDKHGKAFGVRQSTKRDDDLKRLFLDKENLLPLSLFKGYSSHVPRFCKNVNLGRVFQSMEATGWKNSYWKLCLMLRLQVHPLRLL